MDALPERLERGEILVADGAIGTMLFARGLKPGDYPESVNLENPETLQEIAGLYLQAGADLIQTNTFGASPLKLSLYGAEDRVEEINRNAVQAVRAAVEGRAYVSASCGPSGKILKPYGDTDPDDVYDSFRRQMRCLIEAGVDVVCVETMVDLAEAAVAVKAAKDVSRGTPVMATMTFDATPRGFFTIMGVSIEQAARGLEQAGASVLGSNCGNGVENMIKIAEDFRRCSTLPILVQPNAGLPQTKHGALVYDETPSFMAEKAKALIAAGVSIIGGCCGTTPEYIAAIRKTVDSVAER
jgi:5-methyltetrahydrofolate--homocysteine methyltransferase